MSLFAVREYFTSHALALGYKKHYDGFATDNIPSTQLHKSFHVEAFNFTGFAQNQSDLQLDAPVTVRLFFGGQRNVDLSIKTALEAGDEYIATVLSPTNRLGTSIKNTVLNQIIIEPYADSNDNLVVCRLEFTSVLFKGIS